MEGRMLIPLGIAFIVSLFASTVIALTLTPVLCSYLLKKNNTSRAVHEPFIARILKKYYIRALDGALRHKAQVLGFAGVLLLAAVAVFFTLGRSFLPAFNEGSFTINVSAVPGISMDESDKIGRAAEQILLTIPEINTVARKTGRAELDEQAMGIHVSEIEAPFTLRKRSKDALAADVRQKLRALPGVSVEIGQPISHRIDAMLSGTRANIAVKLFGADLNRLYAIGNQIKTAVQDVEGIADLNVEQQVARPQLTITPKRGMLAKYGITLPAFARAVRTMLAGETVSQVYEENKTFDLTLKVNDEHRGSMAKIKELMLDARGAKIPLEAVATVASAAGPNAINRENGARKVVVSANVAGRDLRGVVDDMQRCIAAAVALPEGYRIEYGGQFESEQSASRTLFAASLLAILLIFVLLYNDFKSATQAAIVLLNLPLALIGGVFILRCTGGVVSIPAVIGFISLFGIATRNGMLLLTRYNDLRADGLSAAACIRQGSLDRLNPILMTALTSALALTPLALGGDLPGNEIQSPMAQVILGGLLTSTLLNAFVIPLMYMITNRTNV